jgi:hypothetical protein
LSSVAPENEKPAPAILKTVVIDEVFAIASLVSTFVVAPV